MPARKQTLPLSFAVRGPRSRLRAAALRLPPSVSPLVLVGTVSEITKVATATP